MRIKKSTVFLTMFVLLLAFTGCQNESSSTDENKQTKSTASDKVIYNQKINLFFFLLHQRKIQMFLCNILMIHMEKRGHCFVAN